MRNKPFYFKAFPFIALSLAIGFPLQIHFLYSIPVSDINKIMSMLTPLNLITMTSFMIAAFLVANINKGIQLFIPLLLIITLSNNLFVATYGVDYSYGQAILSFAGLLLLSLPFYEKKNLKLIRNPSLHWWKTPKRYELTKQLEIRGDNFKIFGESLNISSTGIFAAITEPNILDTLAIDNIVNIKIMDEVPINLSAKIVRKASHGPGPAGFGLQFINDNDLKLRFKPWFKRATQAIY